MPLSEIEEIIKSGNVDGLSGHLALQKSRIAGEIEELQGKPDDIQWYEKYFAYMKDDPLDGHTYKIILPERYAIFEEYKEGDTVETIETRLVILKHRCEAASLAALSHCLRIRRSAVWIPRYTSQEA